MSADYEYEHDITAPSGVQKITDETDFDRQMDQGSDPNILHVLDFSADWCGPCQKIKPVIEQWCREYSNVQFYCIDVDRCEALAEQFEIDSMPTFILWRQGKEIDRCKGANERRLRDMIDAHLEE